MTDINEKNMVPENEMEEGKQRSAELARLAIGADYFIIASGNNRAQVQAMADEVEQRMGRAGAAPRQIEGYQAGNWVLMDFGDVIIHIFDAQNRLFYDLERIWKDGTQIDPEQL